MYGRLQIGEAQYYFSLIYIFDKLKVAFVLSVLDYFYSLTKTNANEDQWVSPRLWFKSRLNGHNFYNYAARACE